MGGWSVGAGLPLPVQYGVHLADGGCASLDESLKLKHEHVDIVGSMSVADFSS